MTGTDTEIERQRVEEFVSTTVPTTLRKLNKILESSKVIEVNTSIVLIYYLLIKKIQPYKLY